MAGSVILWLIHARQPPSSPLNLENFKSEWSFFGLNTLCHVSFLVQRREEFHPLRKVNEALGKLEDCVGLQVSLKPSQ